MLISHKDGGFKPNSKPNIWRRKATPVSMLNTLNYQKILSGDTISKVFYFNISS